MEPVASLKEGGAKRAHGNNPMKNIGIAKMAFPLGQRDQLPFCCLEGNCGLTAGRR
jgi:hypothetical protein